MPVVWMAKLRFIRYQYCKPIFLSGLGEYFYSIESSTSVTRFDNILPLWGNVECLGPIYADLFNILLNAIGQMCKYWTNNVAVWSSHFYGMLILMGKEARLFFIKKAIWIFWIAECGERNSQWEMRACICQMVRCCVCEITKQYRECVKGNKQIWLTIR